MLPRPVLTRKNSGTASTVVESQIGASHLEELFQKLQSLKKTSMLNFFKKQVEVPEEDVLRLMLRFIEHISLTEYYNFIMGNYKDIQVFLGISFNPMHKNKSLADLCIKVSLKLITRLAELFTDVMQQRREFKNQPQKDISRVNILNNLFRQSVCFLSLLFVKSIKYVEYKMKVDKQKIFQNLLHRLGSPASSLSNPQQGVTDLADPWVMFKSEIYESVNEKDIPKLITMCQAWFEVVGDLLERPTKKIEIVRESFSLELQTRIKHRNKIFELLDEYCEKLLQLNEQKEGLMGLMEKNLARYINNVLQNSDSTGNTTDLDLFRIIFILINRLFQRRNKLFGSNMDEEEIDYYLSGGSEEGKDMAIMSTLSREIHDENSSFMYLQSMTGKLYLQLISNLLCGSDNQGVEKFNVFFLFINEDGFVSFIEIFEPLYSQKLIKKVLINFRKYVEQSADNPEMKRRLTILLGIDKCSNRQCTCFIDHLLKIFFKLAMKCSLAAIKEIMDLFYELIKSFLLKTNLSDRVAECYLICFNKMFTSLLKQNLDTIDKMTIQLMNTMPDNDDSEDGDRHQNILVMDLRKTVSHTSKKLDVFMEHIGIQGLQVKMTKEMCESVLLILSSTHRVDDFLSNQQYKIDLGLDEYSYVTAQDVIEAVQKRWQVKLMAFRTLMIEVSSKILKNLFAQQNSESIFHGYLRFFKQINSQRGTSTHSLYVGFITYIFMKEFNLANYSSDHFANFLVIFDITLRGLGYYDRDSRLSLPSKVQKEFMELSLQHLKIKFEPQNSRLVALQLLICYRYQEMFTIDPPVIKCLVPLIFDIANELSGNWDKVDINSPQLIACLKLILEDNYLDPINSLLVIMIRLFTSVVTVVIPYAKFPIILKPHLIVSGRNVLAGGFPYQTFEDLKNFLLRSEHITSLIHLIDSKSTKAAPQVELSKYLSISACYCQEILLVIYPALLSHCLEYLHCSDEVFKVRMQLFMSFLTLEKFVFTCSTALSQFIEKSQGLLLTLTACETQQEHKTQNPLGESVSSNGDQKSEVNSFSSSSSNKITYCKKQWVLTLLMKWVFLSTQAQLPIEKLWDMVFTLKQSKDAYLLENCKILESYLSSIKGIFDQGAKELRDPSYFDENNLMSRKKMHIMMQMIDKFCRDEQFEEEARLLQQNFEINLFEFFSHDRRKLSVNKLFEQLLSKVKKNDFKWIFLYDAKNIIVYSMAETDKQEICLIKRHISGKNSWFLQENFENIYESRQKLEIIHPRTVPPMPCSVPNNENLLIRLLEFYRKEPEIFNHFSTKSFEENVLPLANTRFPDRVSSVDTYPSYLKDYYQPLRKIPEMSRQSSMQSNITEISQQVPFNLAANNQENPPFQVDSLSYIENPQSPSQSSKNNFKLFDNLDICKEFQGKNKLLNENLTDPCVRFILQMEMFCIPGQNKSYQSDYYLISPEGEKLTLFKNDLSFIDKSRIVSCFKVGVLLVGPNQGKEEEILSNSFPSSGLFNTFVNNLGDKISESAFAKCLGNDMIQYQVGPLIPRKDKSTFEVKRIVGNVPSLIIWSQNELSNDYDNIKSKFNRDIIIVEELSSKLLRIRSQRKVEDRKLDTVFLPDSLLTLNSLLMILPSYIYASQMELNPIIFSALKEEYKSISPFLDARKKQLTKLLESNKEDVRRMKLETLLDIVFHGLR